MTWLETIRLLPVPSVIEPARPELSSHTPRRAPEGSGVRCPFLCLLGSFARRRLSRPSASSVIPVAFRGGGPEHSRSGKTEETSCIVYLGPARVSTAACVPGSRPMLLIDSGPLSFPLPRNQRYGQERWPDRKDAPRVYFYGAPRWPFCLCRGALSNETLLEMLKSRATFICYVQPAPKLQVRSFSCSAH